MKKIIAQIKPFTLNQKLTVMEDGNQVTEKQTTLEELNATIYALALEYDISDITIAGPKKFCGKIKSELETMDVDMPKFSAGKLNITLF